MKKGSVLLHVLELNLAVLFISISGTLGRWIELPVTTTICMRAILAGLIMYLFCRWKGYSLQVDKTDRWTMFLGGALLGIHWMTYFYALQLSNVAIGMLSLFTYPVLTAILEPLLLKTRVLPVHLLLGVCVLFGIYFLVPDLDVQSDTAKAVGFGVFSALCFAVRNILLKSKVPKYRGEVLMFHQLVVMAVCLVPFLFLVEVEQLLGYLPAVGLLAVLTTALGHTLFLYSLKHFSTATASIISSVQPVYGILIGILVLQEYPKAETWIGGGIIVLTVLAESLRLKHEAKKKASH